MDSFLIEYMHVALENDANPNVRAMTHYVENPDRIEEYDTLLQLLRPTLKIFLPTIATTIDILSQNIDPEMVSVELYLGVRS